MLKTLCVGSEMGMPYLVSWIETNLGFQGERIRICCGDNVYYARRDPDNPRFRFILEEDDPATCIPEETAKGESAVIALFLLENLRKQEEGMRV